jgi:hypothetical protein
VLAIGRREWKRSARCIAGNGDVEAGVGCEAMEPAEERLAISGCNVSLGKARFKEGTSRSVPDCAESLRSIAPLIASLIALPSLLYAAFASPRLVVNTFKHTLRGGISSLFLFCSRRWMSGMGFGKEGRGTGYFKDFFIVLAAAEMFSKSGVRCEAQIAN